MNKFLLSRHLNETVEFSISHGKIGYGDVVTMGDGNPGISSGHEVIPWYDVKNVRRPKI